MTNEQDIPQYALELSDALRPALYRVYRQIRRENGDSDSGVTPFQNLLMTSIYKNPGIGVAELARMENLRGPTMSGHIKSLEAAGLVQRSAPDPEDRRRNGLEITAAGEAILSELRNRRRDWMARRLMQLSPEALDALRSAIEPLNEIGK